MEQPLADPLIEIRDAVKAFGGLRPLRVRRLTVAPGERLVVGGLDAAAAETLVHLVTGASVPDAGAVMVAGRNTRDIATDTEWLTSLDRFGIVTRRAVLLDSLSIAANLALPLTIAIDPIAPDTRRQVGALATLVELPESRLDAAAASLTPAERCRVHLARALAVDPQLLLLEHPTADVSEAHEREALGRLVARIGHARGLGWLAVTEDEVFGRASGSTRVRLNPASGDLAGASWWKKLVR